MGDVRPELNRRAARCARVPAFATLPLTVGLIRGEGWAVAMDDVWVWERVDPARSGSSGDLAKLFRNETVEQPSMMEFNKPSTDATLMARELIQNSWDAARELAHQLGDEAPHFDLRFVFDSASGDRKTALIECLGLAELRARASGGSPKETTEHRSALGIPESNALDHIGNHGEPLRFLKVVESGTTCMYGPWEEDKSKLYLALVSHGMTEKESGAGGSYGYGKAGLIRGSRFRTVIAYTCFRESEHEPCVTRRLLGMTYWGRNSFQQKSYTGFARFGARRDGDVVPFENDDADNVALSLGINTRSANEAAQLGTTFLVIDPTCESAELVEAISRSWWPALIEHRFSVSVDTYDGDRLVPRPKKSEVLRAFIEGHEWASRPRDNNIAGKRQWISRDTALETGRKVRLGRIGLVSDIETWSYPTVANSEAEDDGDEDAARVDHRSLVALVRGPAMVVEYFDAGKTAPFVRGTFIADSDVDDLLRQTEPKAHNHWQDVTRPDIPAEATEVAKKVRRKIKEEVNLLRKQLKPKVPDPSEIRLPELERLFREITSGQGRADPPPPPGEPEHAVRVKETRLTPTTSGEIVCEAEVELSLTERGCELAAATDDRLHSQVLVKLQYVEDGRRGEEVPLDSLLFDGSPAPPPGTHGWRGWLVRSEAPTTILVKTTPYSSDATAALVAEVRVVPPANIVSPIAGVGGTTA